MNIIKARIVFLILCAPIFLCAEGAVASGHPLATRVGLEVLERGGNAFDAAIAIGATLGVVEPPMTGLGGYGSTLVYDAKRQEIHYLNSCGKFPRSANSDLMRAPTEHYLKNRQGAKSISTPSNLNGWKEMHEKFGQLPWCELFKDAIHYARSGFAVSPYIAKLIASSFDEFPEVAKSIYGKKGDLLVQSDLAKSYELIAQNGVDPFYRGEIARLIDRQMKEMGSFLTIEDLEEDRSEWLEPIKLTYRGHDIYTMGAPGNGFVTLFILGVMEQFPLNQMGQREYLHVLIEVIKESARVRVKNPGSRAERKTIVNQILSEENFSSVAKRIDKTLASNFDSAPVNESMNTTHFVVVDKWGNMVSSTQTLGLGFGSKVMIEGTGIWMNNSMAFSTFEPKGNPMDVFPGSDKLSSNSPIIIMKDDSPWAALGTPGGHTIPQNTAQIIINLIDFGMSIQEAIDAPKVAFFEEGSVVCTEKGIDSSTLLSLKELGHKIDNENIASYIGLSGKIGNAMGIMTPSFETGIDRRKDGWSI